MESSHSKVAEGIYHTTITSPVGGERGTQCHILTLARITILFHTWNYQADPQGGRCVLMLKHWSQHLTPPSREYTRTYHTTTTTTKSTHTVLILIYPTQPHDERFFDRATSSPQSRAPHQESMKESRISLSTRLPRQPGRFRCKLKP